MNVNVQESRLNWSPDSRWLPFADKSAADTRDRIFALSVDTGARHGLSSPPAREEDLSPAVSPDGRLLALVRDATQFASSIVLIPLGTDLRPAGSERRLDIPELRLTTFDYPRWISFNELIVNVRSGRFNRRLWRVDISGRKRPEMLGELGEHIGVHTISADGSKLAFSRGIYDTNIRRLDLSGPQGKVLNDQQLIASSRWDQNPALSPDASKMVFESTRTGFSEIWIASRDGSNAAPLTRFESAAGSPRWSPDGNMIAFDGRKGDQVDIYVMAVSGGPPKRMTDDPAADILPVWSVDGKWIYFCSERSGKREIWRIPADGGSASRITFHGAFESVTSPDGEWIYYGKEQAPVTSIWRIPASGGEERLIVDGVRTRFFDVTAKGLYFGAGSSASSSTDLRFLDFASSKILTLASFERVLRHRASVSRDDRFMANTQLDHQGYDLVLIENVAK